MEWNSKIDLTFAYTKSTIDSVNFERNNVINTASKNFMNSALYLFDGLLIIIKLMINIIYLIFYQ